MIPGCLTRRPAFIVSLFVTSPVKHIHSAKMATSKPYSTDAHSFGEHLKGSKRIIALLGAGLSASSGLPTFRGAGGLWRNHDAVSLATPEAFDQDPALVWRFYSYRRHMALNAKPNKAHFALAELAKKNKEFITLSQNVDGSLYHLCLANFRPLPATDLPVGLSPRAGHPPEQLHLLHGSLFDVKCSGFYCTYLEKDNFADPIVPSLAIPLEAPKPMPSSSTDGSEAASSLMASMRYQNSGRELDISNANVPLAHIPPEELPRCPKCHNLLRPGVVWFGESLPTDTLDAIDQFLEGSTRSDDPASIVDQAINRSKGSKDKAGTLDQFTDQSSGIDLILVIGTSAKVYPAAGYVDIARQYGARVAVVNMDTTDIPGGSGGLTSRDWFFEGDAGVLVPEMLKPVIGEV